MPGAHPPAKDLCLLLASASNLCPVRISKGGNRGGKSSKQHMQLHKEKGEAQGDKVVPVAPLLGSPVALVP
jgi:hypothetical protein